MAKKKAQDVPQAHGPVRLELHGEEAWLLLEGSVHIAHARELHALAREAAATSLPVVVQAQRLQRIDVAATQVLLALRETLLKQGQHLSWSGAPASVLESMRLAGLAESFGV
jgi:anti-anti-sigma regulatory factor